MLHKVQKTLMLETDVPETVNEMIVACRKGGSAGIIAAYAGFCNGFNLGALMEKGVRLVGNGQAPVKKYWEKILNDYIIPGKFDPTLYVSLIPSCQTAAVDEDVLVCSMISHRVPIDDMAKLYAAFDKREAGVKKVRVLTLWFWCDDG